MNAAETNTPLIRKPLLIGGLIIIAASVFLMLYLNMPSSTPRASHNKSAPSPSLALVEPTTPPPTRVDALPETKTDGTTAEQYRQLAAYVMQHIEKDTSLSPAEKERYKATLLSFKQIAETAMPELDPQLLAVSSLNKQLRLFTLQNQVLDQQRKMMESNFEITKTRIESSKLLGDILPSGGNTPSPSTSVSTSTPAPAEVDTASSLSSLHVTMIYGINSALQAIITSPTKKYKVKEGDTFEKGTFHIIRISPRSVEIFSKNENRSQTYTLPS